MKYLWMRQVNKGPKCDQYYKTNPSVIKSRMWMDSRGTLEKFHTGKIKHID